MTDDNGDDGTRSGRHDPELENQFTERQLIEAYLQGTVAGGNPSVPLAVVSQAVAGTGPAAVIDTDELISLLSEGAVGVRDTQRREYETTQTDSTVGTRTEPSTGVTTLALTELLSELDQQSTQIEHQQEQLREQREDIEALREKLEAVDRHLTNNDPEY